MTLAQGVLRIMSPMFHAHLSEQGDLYLGASSSNYSEWNIDNKWSSQEWKSGEMSGTSTGRP